MVKLKGLYPSVSLNGGSVPTPELSRFWFSNLEQQEARSDPGLKLVNRKNHEVMVKVRALKLSGYVEELVKEDFPSGYYPGETADGSASASLDYELCLM